MKNLTIKSEVVRKKTGVAPNTKIAVKSNFELSGHFMPYYLYI